MGAPKFFGRVVAREASPHGACAIVDHDAPRPLPAHDHRLAYFCCLARGGYEETAGRRLEYLPGSVIFHPASLHHHDRITAPRTRLVIVELDVSRLDQLRDLRPTAARDVVRCDRQAGLIMCALEARLAGRASDDAARVRTETRKDARERATAVVPNDPDMDTNAAGDADEDLVFELLGVLARLRDERTPGAWLVRAEELMAEEAHHTLRVADIAARVGVHPVRLARAIRRRHRCSVSDHLHAIRLDRACRLLRATDTPLTDVAAALGYADQSHFTRVFSARLGISPSRFRAATR